LTRNKADFIGGMLHGSTHEFKPGDIVEPRNSGVAWASNSSHAAKIYGGANSKVYVVKPIGKYTTMQGPRIDEKHYTSTKGFRVVGEHNG
jgi:hypothetical protein